MIIIGMSIMAMMNSAKLRKEIDIRATSMMVMAKMKVAAMEVQANAMLFATKMVAMTNTNSHMAVVQAGKVRYLK